MRIAVIVLSLFSVSFALAYVSVLKRLESITKAFAQLVVLNSTIQEAFEASIQSPVSKEDQDIHKENFIKFLSDSRDWAFEYIEDVQKQLEEFIRDIEPEIMYFDEYGIVGDAYPHYHSMKKISSAYKDLKKMLPEEADDRR
jgi:alpha-L-fucosidase